MSWIESHQKLQSDAKVVDLMTELGWSKAEAIGRLHMFWWWCVDHAEDGDLRRFNDNHLSIAVELNAQDGKRFVGAMVKFGLLDREPYFRVHNWWKYSGRFMKQRYKDAPERWKRIEYLYSTVTATVTVTDTATVTATQETNIPTDKQTDQPTNQQTRTGVIGFGFDDLWTIWPKKENREGGVSEWNRLKPEMPLVAEILAAAKEQIKLKQWTATNQYTPMLAKWLQQRRWEDKVMPIGGQPNARIVGEAAPIEDKYPGGKPLGSI